MADGTAKLCGFSRAGYLLGGEQQELESAAVVGVADGCQKRTEKSDVFWLGLLLWQLFNAQNVLNEQYAEGQHPHETDPMMGITNLPAGGEELRSIITRCWPKRADTRPSAGEVFRELQSLYPGTDAFLLSAPYLSPCDD